jgi:tRNA dimethylallyltransferase
LDKLAGERGVVWLHDRLAKLDDVAAQKIDPRNVRRTVRAMEVVLTTGRRFSEQRSKADSPYRLITIGLSQPRPELYARIDARIEAMFAAGLLQEVRGLLAKGYPPSQPSMSAIGYAECVRALEGRLDVEQAKQEIRRATRVFVRRQANWFKPDDPGIQWFRVHAGVAAEIESHVRPLIDF